MIKKLRFKLIMAAMASLLAVLLVIMTAVSVISYRKVVDDADTTLALLAENDGFFPKLDHDGPRGELPAQKNFPMSPEMPYETRYFFVSLDREGGVNTVNTGKIAAVDSSTAIQYARTVWEEGEERGFVEDYRFLRHQNDGETMVLFLDCTRSLDSFRALLLTCVGVSAVGALLVLLLLIFLSGRIVRPFLESYEKQKRFITDAGHELKTPLTIINADTEILEMDLGDNEWLKDIQAQTKRLSGLTHDLILLARMEEEQAPRQKVEFPLSDLVEEAAAAFQAVAITQGKTLTARVQPMLSMVGDENALSKLVSILLDNAVKYASPGGEITCVLERQKNWLRLTVSNPTEGMSELRLERLFERFYRGDPSRNSQTGGYGLGLSIAAAVAAAHKGKLTAAREGELLRITAAFPV